RPGQPGHETHTRRVDLHFCLPLRFVRLFSGKIFANFWSKRARLTRGPPTVKLRGEFLQFFSPKNSRKTGRELLQVGDCPRPPKSPIIIWRNTGPVRAGHTVGPAPKIRHPKTPKTLKIPGENAWSVNSRASARTARECRPTGT